jgi:NAD(P) transhydrogenase subunit alpha
MNIAVLNETSSGEARVALMPDSIQKLVAAKASVSVESGAGLGAARTDDDFTNAGAAIVKDPKALLADADVLVCVSRPADEVFQSMKKGAVVLGFLRPLDEPAKVSPALENGLTTFSMELVPRITRAQAMDALSSMATVAGLQSRFDGGRSHPAYVSPVDDGRGHGASGARACAGRRGRGIASDRDRPAVGCSGRGLRRARRGW